MNRVLAAAVVIVGTSLGASAAAAPQHETLIVYKAGSGSGHVGSRPPYIDCGNVCYAPLPVEETGGVPIVLRATPDPGSVFTGWGGACEGAEPTCTLELQRSERVTAIFDRTGAQTSFPLAVGKTGEGTVRSSPAAISCEPSCSASFTSGTSVTLTATPAAGWTFAGWSGDDRDCVDGSVTMDSAKRCIATFARQAA